jgi:hypothetical protein
VVTGIPSMPVPLEPVHASVYRLPDVDTARGEVGDGVDDTCGSVSAMS